MGFGFPVTPVDVALSADVIEIPKGHPGEILRAAGKLSATAALLERGSHDVRGAGTAAVGAAEGWNGAAASNFDALAGLLGADMHGGVGALRHAAAACKAFGHDLEEQQDLARDARRDAREAEGRAKAAVTVAQRASADEVSANLDASAAASAVAVARGSADHAGATQHERAERTARDQAGQARAAAGRARAQLAGANDDITRAAKRAEIANQRAEDAALRAQAALHHAAAAAKSARTDLGPIPVPVAPTPVNTNPLAGTAPFALPFRALAPGDVRRHQIEAEAERARKAEENRPLNALERAGRNMFSTGFAPVDALTLGGAGSLIRKTPGGRRLYSPSAGGAKVTQYIGPGLAGERVAVVGGRAISKRLPTGPMKPIFRRDAPRPRPPELREPREPIKIKISPDGKVSRVSRDERHLGPKQTSGDMKEAGSRVGQILINAGKAIDDMHIPPHPGG